APAPRWCGVDRLRPVDRYRGRDGRGLEQPRRDDMATIGSFKKSGNEVQGEIVTLTGPAKAVRIAARANRPIHNAPSHRALGRAELDAAASPPPHEGPASLSFTLGARSFTTPLYATPSDDEGAETFSPICSRGRSSNAD